MTSPFLEMFCQGTNCPYSVHADIQRSCSWISLA
jgi:hypothetical protein